MKNFNLIVILSLIFSLFSACGDNSENEKGQTLDDELQTEEDSFEGNDDDFGSTSGGESAADDDFGSTSGEEGGNGCVEIDVPLITSCAYKDEITGFFTPNLGDSGIDFIKFFLLGELEPGSYDLGSDKNKTYKNCQQCAMIWVDVGEGKAKEAYFQKSGNLTITKVAGRDAETRTNGFVENATLVKANFGTFTPIPDSTECVFVKWAEWETIKEEETQDLDFVDDSELGDDSDSLLGDDSDSLLGDDSDALLGDDSDALLGDDSDSLFGDDSDALLGDDSDSLLGDDADALFGDDADSLLGDDSDSLFGDDSDSLLGDDSDVV